MTKNQIRIGTGGVPHTAKGIEKGIERLHELGLEHMELEFVQSVFVKEEKTAALKAHAEANDITLSVHGSYYTNFASDDKPKWHASINRIISAGKIGAMCGAKSVTYHSGFFQGKDFATVKPLVLDAMREVLDAIKKADLSIKIAPELTGKASQVGDIDELVDLVKVLKDEGYTDAALCIDFAHKYARDGDGKHNSYDEFMAILDKIATGLGAEYLSALHMHVSAIQYGDKGEKNHLLLLPDLAAYKAEGVVVDGIESAWDAMKPNRHEENKFNWRELFQALKTANVGGYLVCESPILELDALLMQKYYQSL